MAVMRGAETKDCPSRAVRFLAREVFGVATLGRSTISGETLGGEQYQMLDRNLVSEIEGEFITNTSLGWDKNKRAF